MEMLASTVARDSDGLEPFVVHGETPYKTVQDKKGKTTYMVISTDFNLSWKWVISISST
jgi:hypothetical protein